MGIVDSARVAAQEISAKRASPLTSPAIGTGLEELVRPCGDATRPKDPSRAPGRTTFAMTFSGGGFRATLAALGVARFLADAGVLGDVRFVSSVSGGSIANGMLATRWRQLRSNGFSADALDRFVVDPLVESVSGSSLKGELIRNIWRAIGPRTRTDVLARAFDRRFFDGARLEDLDDGCRFIINAANLVTGVRFAFERDVVGDYVVGLASTGGTGLRVSTAVAASAAVPGAFAPVTLPKVSFPCGERGGPQLLDGGAYDNTGLEAIDSDRYQDVFSVTMNAGGVFVTGRLSGVPLIRDLVRSNGLLYRQSTGLRTRWMVDRFRAWNDGEGHQHPQWARRGVLFALASEMKGSAVDEWRSRHPEHRSWEGKDLAFVPTVFDKLDRPLCRLLIYRGWWLTGAAFALYYPDLLELPHSAPPLE